MSATAPATRFGAVDQPVMPPPHHYFEESPQSRSDERTIEVVLPDVSFEMRTDRGVFSHGRLDTGTAILLRGAPPPPPVGTFVDLGCGAGAIALTLAMRAPLASVRRGRRELAGAVALQRQRRSPRIDEHHRRPPGRGARRHRRRPDLVEPADPYRQAGTPRDPRDVARAAGTWRVGRARRAAAPRR